MIRTLTIALVCSATIAAACSDDAPPAAAGGTTLQPPVTTPSADGGADAGDSRGACEADRVQTGELVEEERTDRPAEPFGGELREGTYVLRDMFLYVPSEGDGGESEDDPKPELGKTGRGGVATLVVTATELTFYGARGDRDALPAATTSSMSYTISDTKLVGQRICPPPRGAQEIPFSAVGNGLSLFLDATHRETYIRID
ncbi:MAG: hypothetical protein KF894_26065 [Labilithrix sp.]|nr:hypothetical protein [Labilithrix sp.]